MPHPGRSPPPGCPWWPRLFSRIRRLCRAWLMQVPLRRDQEARGHRARRAHAGVPLLRPPLAVADQVSGGQTLVLYALACVHGAEHREARVCSRCINKHVPPCIYIQNHLIALEKPHKTPPTACRRGEYDVGYSRTLQSSSDNRERVGAARSDPRISAGRRRA